jgi:hypothetical protein
MPADPGRSRWLLTYFHVGLECDWPILEALFFSGSFSERSSIRLGRCFASSLEGSVLPPSRAAAIVWKQPTLFVALSVAGALFSFVCIIVALSSLSSNPFLDCTPTLQGLLLGESAALLPFFVSTAVAFRRLRRGFLFR